MLNRRTLVLCMARVSVSACAMAQCIDAPRLEWVGTNGAAGAGSSDGPTRWGMAISPDGRCGLAGTMEVECDADPTDNTFIISPFGIHDALVNFAAAGGEQSDNLRVGGPLFEMALGISADASGFAYCGEFDQDTGGDGYCVDFNPFEGEDIHCAKGERNRPNGFITRFDSDGTYLWTRTIGGPQFDLCDDIAHGGGSFLAVTGFFEGTADFDPSPAEYLLTVHGSGSRDAYLLSLDLEGNFRWAVGIGGVSQDEGIEVATDADGNIYWTGRFAESVDFDPGPGEDILFSQSGEDLFVCKYTSEGSYVWARSVNTNTGQYNTTIIASDDGRLLLAGGFRDRVDFDPTSGVDSRRSAGETDAYVSMWTTDGGYLWTAAWGAESYDGARAAFDRMGDVIIAGGFHNTVDFDPGSGQDIRSAAGLLDAFVGKLSRNGDLHWLQTFGDVSNEAVDRLSVDPVSNDIWLDGMFMGTVDFDPGPGEAIRTSVGERDLFLMKMTCDGRGCEELTAHSATGGTGSVESRVSTLLSGGKAAIQLEGDALRAKQKARLAGDGSGSTTFRDLPPGRYRVTVAKLKTAEGTRVCNGELMERFVEVK